MEILTLPGMGLDRGRMSFLMHPDQTMQFIAVRDIGRIAAAVFGSPDRYAGRTMEIAGDALTGKALAEHLAQAAGRPISYSRLPATRWRRMRSSAKRQHSSTPAGWRGTGIALR